MSLWECGGLRGRGGEWESSKRTHKGQVTLIIKGPVVSFRCFSIHSAETASRLDMQLWRAGGSSHILISASSSFLVAILIVLSVCSPLCLGNAGTTPSTDVSLGLSWSERNQLVEFHSSIRARVQPTAANMAMLVSCVCPCRPTETSFSFSPEACLVSIRGDLAACPGMCWTSRESTLGHPRGRKTLSQPKTR